MNPHYPNPHYPNVDQRHPDYFSHRSMNQHSLLPEDADVKPFAYATTSMMGSSSNLYSTSDMDARTRNARAQARHRAKRKAYISNLEASLASLQATLKHSNPDARVQQLQEENARLRQESAMLRAQLQALTSEEPHSGESSKDEGRSHGRKSSGESGTVFTNPPMTRSTQPQIQQQAIYGGQSPSTFSHQLHSQPSRPRLTLPYMTSQSPSSGFAPSNAQASSQQFSSAYLIACGTPSPSASDEGSLDGRKVEEPSSMNYVQGAYLQSAPNSASYNNIPSPYNSATSSAGSIYQSSLQSSVTAPGSNSLALSGSGIGPFQGGIQGWEQERQ